MKVLQNPVSSVRLTALCINRVKVLVRFVASLAHFVKRRLGLTETMNVSYKF